MFKVSSIRNDFPILDKGVIYLDSAAISLTSEQVVLKEMEFYREYRANVERGVHRWSQQASLEYEEAHEEAARFINTPGPENVAILRNTTEGINLVANSINWKKDDKIVTAVIEHHSNFITWLRVGNRFGCKVNVVRATPEGEFDLSDFEKVIDEKNRIVALTGVTNVLGVILPVKEIAEIAHEHGSKILVDARAKPYRHGEYHKLRPRPRGEAY